MELPQYKCEFAKKCGDITRMNSELEEGRIVDEGLVQQYELVCTTPGSQCVIRKKFLSEQGRN